MATTTQAIQISVDGIFAGAGRLVGGIIEDCGAQFCSDSDESENVYELIEGAIADGLASVRVDLSDDRLIRVSWNISDEQGAAGWESTQTTRAEARAAVLAQVAEIDPNSLPAAYHTGFAACEAGELRSANPYVLGSWDNDDWHAGWDAA